MLRCRARVLGLSVWLVLIYGIHNVCSLIIFGLVDEGGFVVLVMQAFGGNGELVFRRFIGLLVTFVGCFFELCKLVYCFLDVKISKWVSCVMQNRKAAHGASFYIFGKNYLITFFI